MRRTFAKLSVMPQSQWMPVSTAPQAQPLAQPRALALPRATCHVLAGTGRSWQHSGRSEVSPAACVPPGPYPTSLQVPLPQCRFWTSKK